MVRGSSRSITWASRMVDLLIDSPAVGPVQVRLLLPVGFSKDSVGKGATTTYPSLYLLHGGGGEYTDWTTNTHVEAWTAPTNLMVVMPGAGSSAVDGWYTDWQGSGAAGRPQWETFHLDELPQLLERNWQAGPNRAVAGSRWAATARSSTRNGTRASSRPPRPTAASST